MVALSLMLFTAGAFNLLHELSSIKWRSLERDTHLHSLHWECRSHAEHRVRIIAVAFKIVKHPELLTKPQHPKTVPNCHWVSVRPACAFENVMPHRGTACFFAHLAGALHLSRTHRNDVSFFGHAVAPQLIPDFFLFAFVCVFNQPPYPPRRSVLNALSEFVGVRLVCLVHWIAPTSVFAYGT